MGDQDSQIDLEKNFLETVPLSTSPEYVSQILSSFEPSANRREDILPHLIFCACFKYMMAKLPDGFVDGIWDEILRKAIMYTKNYSFLMRTEIYQVLSRFSPKVVSYDHSAMTKQMRKWIGEVLSSYSNCPNPYLRLELFRLIRMLAFNNEKYVNLESVCEAFIHTICEIYPVHFYPSGGKDEMLFGVRDFYYFIKQLRRNYLFEHISEIEKNNYSRTSTFISHFIQSIGVFARVASSIKELELCCKMLKTFWGKYYYVVSKQQFHHYVCETVRELTTAINNFSSFEFEKTILLQHLIDFYSQDLDVDISSKPSDLPRLLMSRQVHGPRAIHQHVLLSRDLSHRYMSQTYPDPGNVASDEGEDSWDSDNSSYNNNYRANSSNNVSSSEYSYESSSDDSD